MPVPITPAPGHRTIRARETLIYRTGRGRHPPPAGPRRLREKEMGPPPPRCVPFAHIRQAHLARYRYNPTARRGCVSPKERHRLRSARERAWMGAPFARFAFVAVALSLIAAWSTLAHATGRTRPAAKAAGKCVNSFDPSCGAFYWDPTPAANHPMTAAVTPAALSGIAGREVAFDTTTADPDAQIACHW